MEHFVHIREQGSKENLFPLIGGEVAVAGGQAGGDDKQQDKHKIKRSSKIKIFIYKVTCILCSSRYVGVIQSGLDKKEHVECS